MPSFRTTLLALTLFCSVSLAQDSRAVSILKHAQEAAGGVEALSAVRDQIISRGIHSVGGGMSGQQVVKIILPSALRQESALPFGMVTLSLVDGSGRILLTPPLREYAQLEKKGVLLGQGKKLELWSESSWISRRDSWLEDQSSLELPDELQTLSL